MIYRVADIEEAVELASRLKDEGQYDWFRGQVRDWHPHSSSLRVLASGDEARQQKARRRVEMFVRWLGSVPELRYLQDEEHVYEVHAIMQHYGIPTHFIDFTTDPGVAGFFAADTASPPPDGMACIYCLNTRELMSLWDTLRKLDNRKGVSIEPVTIDVRNLWRLQAQRGVFLFANYNWDVDYPMDRILFPYTGYPSYPTRERIYPEHKSPLEQLLDQYFFLENATFTGEEIRQWVEEAKARGTPAFYSTIEAWEGGFYADAFVDASRLTPLESWSPDLLGRWEVSADEDYHQASGPAIKLKVDRDAGAEELRKAVSFGVKQVLRSNPAVRQKTVDWTLAELPEAMSQEKLNVTLRPIWNGMRRLPYEDREIAEAFGSAVALLKVGAADSYDVSRRLELFASCFGECLRVGFTNRDGSGSQGIAARDSLRGALRPGFEELLAPKHRHLAGEVKDLFRVIYNPRLMFDFAGFKTMFAREVIPAQAILGRDLILFNPASLTIFGNP